MTVTDAPAVLVVDDEPVTRALIAEALCGAGYRVSAAAGGADALAAALADAPDLVVFDLRMPEMDGGTLCRRLMRDPRTRAAPVLVVTALPAGEAAARLGDCLPDAVVFKPYDLDAILCAVADLLPAPG